MIDPSNQDYPLCKVAKCPDPKISRGGGKGAKYSTQTITYHMDRYHPKQFGPFLQEAAEKKALQDKGASKQTFLDYSRKNPCKVASSQPSAGISQVFQPHLQSQASCSNEGGMIQSLK